MCFLSRSRLQCKHKLFINVGYPEANFSKRTTSGTSNDSKIKLTTHRISAHNRNVLCQIYIKHQQYFCISGTSNSSLSWERIFFSRSAETFMGFQNLAFVVQWRMSQRPYVNGLIISNSQLGTKTYRILKDFFLQLLPCQMSSGLLMEP